MDPEPQPAPSPASTAPEPPPALPLVRPAGPTISWRQLIATLIAAVLLSGSLLVVATLWVLGAGPFAPAGPVASSPILASASPTLGTVAPSVPVATATVSPSPIAATATPIVPTPAVTVSAAPASAAIADPFSVIVDVAARTMPAVVTITSSQSGGFGGQATGIGSGLIFDARGFILTNDHVVSGASQLSVALADGRTFDGTVVADDPALDLAVVKIRASGLPAVAIGHSASLHVGQLVIAIGNPLGTYADSVTSGILSATGRSIDVGTRRHPQQLTNLLQTDAPINPGNSGGPLLDAAGTVIGINTATDPNGQGIGFAIRIDAAQPIIKRALAGGN